MNQNLTTFINGRIITLDESRPIAKSVTVSGGRIIGLDESPVGKIIDLNCGAMIPGLCDAHMHLAIFGNFLSELSFMGVNSPHIIAQMVADEAGANPPGTWIFGRGWDQTFWASPEFPNTEILDALTPDHPVMLTRVDGHAAWVNKCARNLAGYSSDMTLPDGARVVNDCIFIDKAMEMIWKVLPPKDERRIRKYIDRALPELWARGITMVHDAWMDSETLSVIEAMIGEGQFKMNCYGMLASDEPDLLERFFLQGPIVSDRLIIRSVKTFMDGALGSRGAALLEPYSDDPHNRGLILLSGDELESLALKCLAAGFQLNTHAIGDRANRLVLNLYHRVLKGKNPHRWRIEHAQMMAPDDIPMFVENDIIPSMQPSHCTSDMRWLDQRIGDHRTDRISRWNKFINAGLKVAGGSDCPIESGNLLHEIYAATTRQNHSGFPESGWHSAESVKPIDALKMFTSWAAYSAFEDHRRGKITPGYCADFTVLSQDITTIPPSEILNTEVLMTVVGGEVVYEV
ncbi:MAG: amidohydrolase [Candidatus Marinimicrobia bacterium]|nr:amidohydrolase [Candidatus Neomarinimicrobiota bacterium]